MGRPDCCCHFVISDLNRLQDLTCIRPSEWDQCVIYVDDALMTLLLFTAIGLKDEIQHC